MVYNETFTLKSKDACNYKDSENYKSSTENSSDWHSYKYGALLSDPLLAASLSTKNLPADIPRATRTIVGGGGYAAIASATWASHGVKSNERRGLFSSSECSDTKGVESSAIYASSELRNLMGITCCISLSPTMPFWGSPIAGSTGCIVTDMVITTFQFSSAWNSWISDVNLLQMRPLRPWNLLHINISKISAT